MWPLAGMNTTAWQKMVIETAKKKKLQKWWRGGDIIAIIMGFKYCKKEEEK